MVGRQRRDHDRVGKGSRLRRKRRQNRSVELPRSAVACVLTCAALGAGLTWWILKLFVPEAFHPESFNRSPATFIAGLGGTATALMTLLFWSWRLRLRKNNSSQR